MNAAGGHQYFLGMLVRVRVWVVVVVDCYVYYHITTSKNITLFKYFWEVTVQRVILHSVLLFEYMGIDLGKYKS